MCRQKDFFVGKLLPTGHVVDSMEIPGIGTIEATILDVSNPTVLVRAEDLGITGTELPAEVNARKDLCDVLEKIRGTAACRMGFAKDLKDATENSPAVPKVGFVSAPASFAGLDGKPVPAQEMDICARVISVFQCHKACPLTSASAIAVAAALEGSVVQKIMGGLPASGKVRIGHPGGVMTMMPEVKKTENGIQVPSVAVQRTARRIMEGVVYIRN